MIPSDQCRVKPPLSVMHCRSDMLKHAHQGLLIICSDKTVEMFDSCIPLNKLFGSYIYPATDLSKRSYHLKNYMMIDQKMIEDYSPQLHVLLGILRYASKNCCCDINLILEAAKGPEENNIISSIINTDLPVSPQRAFKLIFSEKKFSHRSTSGEAIYLEDQWIEKQSNI